MITLRKDTPDPQLTEQLNAAQYKFDEAYNNNDAAALVVSPIRFWMPSNIGNAPIVGESSIHTLDDLKRRRPNEVAFLLAKLTLEKYFRDDDGKLKQFLV
jgi:hypothetical protein